MKNVQYSIKPDSELDEFHYHEACDRTHVAIQYLENSLAEHPVYQKHESFKSKIDEIISELAELYQVIGGLDDMKSNVS